MKKKVRIYKAGGDTGAYINKTAKWMMDMGGVPDISQLGYPSQQQEQQEMSPDMLMNSVITDLSNQVPEQQIAFKLITIHKLDPVQAKQFINSVKSSLVNSEEEEDEEMAATTNTSSNSLDDEENIIPEEDFETEEEAELVNEDTYEDVDDNQFAADLIMKYGGSKRNYVNSVLKLVKKNLGGDAKSTDTDPIGEDVRDNMKQSFVGTLKNQSIIAKAKEQAEKEYEQLQAMQNNYNQELALQNFIPEEQDYMQFGGQRRAMRQFNRAMRKIPFGMTGPVTKFDVRRSGLFGRPKEYSMEFGMSPLMQLANNPYLSSMYGYGTTSKTIKTPGRIGTEAIAKTTNKKTTEEVASQNTTDATKKSAQPTLEEMRAAATAAGDWGYTPPSVTENTSQNLVDTENDVVVKPSNKDAWGRSKDNKWFGFDPDKKVWSEGTQPEWYKKPTPTIKGASLNPAQNLLGTPNNTLSKMYQIGGMVDNPMSDPYGNLQRFVYGGNDIDQADIDDVYSKDTTDPYFKYGGLTQYAGDEEGSETDENDCPPGATNCFPRKNEEAEAEAKAKAEAEAKSKAEAEAEDEEEATDYETRLAEEKKKWEQEFMQRQNPFGSTPNMMGNFGKKIMEGYGYNPLINNRALPGMPQYMGSWDKTMRAPYDKRTGQQFAGMQGFNPNAQISNINVTKTGMLGRPKKYSITYNNNPTGKPEDRRLAGSAPSMTTPKGTTDTKDLGAGTTGAIGRGERRTARQVARGEKQFPETTDTTPRLGNLEYMQQAKNRNWSYQNTPSANTQYYGPGLKANQVEKREPVNNTPSWITNPSELLKSQNVKYPINNNYNPNFVQRNPKYGDYKQSYEAYKDYYNSGLPDDGYYQKAAPVYKTQEEFDAANNYFKNKYGGLHKFLPQAEPGLETPVTQDERFEPMPMISSKVAGQSLYDQSKQKVMDQGIYEPDEYTKDYKRKDMFAGDLGEALPMINAGLTGVAGLIDKFKNKRRKRKMYDKLNIENLVAVDPSPNKGYEDTNSGVAGDMGQRAYSQSKQYGGAMDDYYEDEEVDMTEEDLADFLANGGEVEYL